MIFSFQSDKGNLRELNEDAYAYSYMKDGSFCVAIADGMGGHNCGEIASRLAVDETIAYLSQIEGLKDTDFPTVLARAIQIANQKIIALSKESPAYNGMGTTIVLLLFFEQTVHIAHVGDSRAYRVSQGEIIQLTKDHSYTEELVKIGYLKREEADKHPRKNVITKALGAFEGSEPDFCAVDLLKDDMIILCTDGLTNMITNEEFADIVNKIKTPDRLCEKLLKTALKNGGRDNVTVAAIKY